MQAVGLLHEFAFKRRLKNNDKADSSADISSSLKEPVGR
jgi:hypothetical protein